MGVDIADLFADVFEFVACSYDVIQEVPHLRFDEVSAQSFPIFYFAVEDVGEIFIRQLNHKICTLTWPPEPQSPAFSNRCF